MERQNKATLSSILARINALVLKRDADFDKYQALSLAQSLVHCAEDTNHKKDPYYNAALHEVRSRGSRPKAQFKAYFMALFLTTNMQKY